MGFKGDKYFSITFLTKLIKRLAEQYQIWWSRAIIYGSMLSNNTYSKTAR